MTDVTFEQLNIAKGLLSTLSDLGYEAPSPIQEKSIPVLLEGKDLLAQAQTGTGKTAAFALPILSQLSLDNNSPQALVLAPTRELAIQVAEAFKSYSKHMKNFHVLPIYGGQDYRGQLKALKRGVQVVVGTPGRVMDHIERGTLVLDGIKTVVLDEADEMLNMGFIDDVKWILKHTSGDQQTALFSATMPPSIKRVVDQYLDKPVHIKIESKSMTVDSILQEYMLVTNKQKLEALTRYLEIEDFTGMIIFTKTKILSSELAEKLEARGYSAAAINGDMKQSQREKVIARIKKGQIDIIVATEVAARGLDVERISHVVNYDIPYDAESYTHRIGRTGRAGRKGKALLFVTPREKNILRDIERTNKQTLALIDVPDASQLNKKRSENFAGKILKAMTHHNLDYYRNLVGTIVHEHELSEADVAAALASLVQKDKLLKDSDIDFSNTHDDDDRPAKRRRPRGGNGFNDRKRGSSDSRSRGSNSGSRSKSFAGKRTSSVAKGKEKTSPRSRKRK